MEYRKRVIAIVGVDGVGKSTLAKKIKSRIRGSEILSFATPLKKHVAWLNSISAEELEADKEMYRQQLIEESKLIRKRKKDFFVNRMLERIKAEVTIIDDVRFENEAKIADVIIRVMEAKDNKSSRYEVDKISPHIIVTQKNRDKVDSLTDLILDMLECH